MPSTLTVGDLFVIQDPDGSLVFSDAGGNQYVNTIAVYNTLRGTYGDHYDLLSVYVDVASGMPYVGTGHVNVFNEVKGVGLDPVDGRASWNSSKLLGFTQYTQFGYTTFLHETAHTWCAFVNHRDTPGGPERTLLHQDWIWGPGQESSHWGRWPDTELSCMDYDQADWVDNGNGTWNRVDYTSRPADDPWADYWKLDLYLMGLIPKSEVGSIRILTNPSPTPFEPNPSPGPYTATTVTIGVDNIVWAEGDRVPDHTASQRVFHEAVVVLTKSTSASNPFIAASESWRSRYTQRFRQATGGRAVVDTSLLRPGHADLYVRDNPDDTGTAPHSGVPFWDSPDVWVRNANDGGTAKQNTIRGQTNWIHVRVNNRNAQPYSRVTVNAYLGNATTLVPGTNFPYPVDWNPKALIGSAVVDVPGNAAATAVIPWPASLIPPATGWHPCLLVEAIPAEVSPSRLHYVFENRKLAQLNLTIVDPPADPGKGDAWLWITPFEVGHELILIEQVELEVVTDPPREEVLLFVDPAELLGDLSEVAETVDVDLALAPWSGELVEALPDVDLSPLFERRREAGSSAWADRNGLEGLHPVSVGRRPLLQVTEPRARLTVPRAPGGRARLSLLGIARELGGEEAVEIDVIETSDGQVRGGLRVLVRGEQAARAESAG